MINIRDHHHHILRPQGGIRLEGVNQRVVERLDFPQRAWARHKTQGAVVRVQKQGRIVPQQHSPLKLRQGRSPLRLPKVIEHLRRPIEGEKLIQKLTPEGPVLRQQGVGRQVGQGRCLIGFQGIRAPALERLGLAPGHDRGAKHFGPIVRRGVQKIEGDGAVPGQRGEERQLPRRQGRQAEERHPGGHGGEEMVERSRGALLQPLKGRSHKRRAIRHRAQGRHGLGPQGALPGLMGSGQTQALPPPPGGQPRGPIDQILIEEVSDALGQLETLQRLLSPIKIMA